MSTVSAALRAASAAFSPGPDRALVLSLDPLLEFVDGLADGRAILLGDIAQALGQPCDLAVLLRYFCQKSEAGLFRRLRRHCSIATRSSLIFLP